MKVQKTFIFTSEPQPNFAKQSSARWAKYKMKVQKIFIFTYEPQPNFAKQSSARWAKYKMKAQKTFIFTSEPRTAEKQLIPKIQQLW